MAIPGVQDLMRPILNALAGREEVHLAEIRDHVAAAERLTDEDKRKLMPNLRQRVFDVRVSFALNKLAYHGQRVVERGISNGTWRLTEDGKLLADGSDPITYRLLKQLETSSSGLSSSDDAAPSQSEELTSAPDEMMQNADKLQRETLEAQLLERVHKVDPDIFEQVVVDLLVAMKYGGGDATMGHVTQRSHDGGIDGIIKEDALGLDKVSIQAKRNADRNKISSPQVQKFAGALDTAGTTKGVFVTTSSFSEAAKKYVEDNNTKQIILIDGEELTRLMVQYNIGVVERKTYKIKQIDEGYFNNS